MHTQKSQKVSNSDKETLKKQQKVPKSAKKRRRKKGNTSLSEPKANSEERRQRIDFNI